jgi:hypothetical protein
MSTPTKPPPQPCSGGNPAEEVSARERLGWLGRNTKLWHGALLLLLLAAIVIAAASGAVFTSSSANPENTFTTRANLSQSNSRRTWRSSTPKTWSRATPRPVR